MVTPTRNRPQSLQRLLRALATQERLPDEVIVADASDNGLTSDQLRAAYPALNITCFHTPPSLSAQRNDAIARARGTHVLLCDDDIEPPPNYLRKLTAWVSAHPKTGAVTGMVCEPDKTGRFPTAFSVPSFRYLLISFLFQLTVWGDVNRVTGNRFAALPLWILKRWYRYRGNSFSLAGWPLVTQIQRPAIRTAIYGLGAALVRRDWLTASPYDEALGPHGIGDNYGVALGFPEPQGITVLTDLPVFHHKAPDNRPDPTVAYEQRVLALDYFMRTSARFSGVNRAFLLWSLAGNAAVFAMRGQTSLRRATFRALRAIVTGRNPLLPNNRGPAPPPADPAP